MPDIPYIVNGTVSNSFGNVVPSGIVKFTNTNSAISITDSIGRYIFDLAGIEYSSGDTISYTAEDEFTNEKFSGSFVVTGMNKTLNITLSVRDDPNTVSGNRDTQISNIGGKPVSSENPFPVEIISGSDDIDLINNPSLSRIITRSDGNPDSETITIRGVQYKRTMTYQDPTGSLLTRSKWIKQ